MTTESLTNDTRLLKWLIVKIIHHDSNVHASVYYYYQYQCVRKLPLKTYRYRDYYQYQYYSNSISITTITITISINSVNYTCTLYMCKYHPNLTSHELEVLQLVILRLVLVVLTPSQNTSYRLGIYIINIILNYQY